MQRYLDHDLNEEDRSLLFEHIHGCEACAEAFERLSDLSARLEKLPQVMPNFSLVDAILPQLEEIDRARLEEGSTAETSALPIMSLDKSASDEVPGDPSGRDVRRRSGGRTLQRSWIYRYGGLGAAAVIILSVFIYQYEPRTLSDAEVSSAIQQSESLNDQHTSNDSAADEVTEEMSLQFKAEESSNTNHEVSSELPDQTAKAPVLDKQPSSTDGSPAAGDSNQQDNPPKASQPNARSGGNSASDQLQAGSPGNSSGGNSSGADQAEPEDQEAMRTEIFKNAEGGADFADPNQQTQQQEPSDKAIVGDTADGSYLLTGQPLVWSSPDGVFEAEVKEEHLYIYKWESEERKQVHAEPLDGDWVTGGWSAEDHIFTYQTEKDGAAINHKFEAGKWAETNAEGEQP